MHTSHAAGFVHVCHASFRQFTSLSLEPLAAIALDPPPVGVHLFPLLRFPFPLPRTPVRLGNVAAAGGLVQILQYASAVIPLVRHRFFDAAQVDLRLFRWSRHRFVLHQLRDRFARLGQRLVNGRGVSLIGPLQRYRQQGAAGQVHGMFGFAEVHALREQLAARGGQSAPAAEAAAPTVEERLEVQETRTAEQAETKVEAAHRRGLMFTGLLLLAGGCLLRVAAEILAYQGVVGAAWSWLPVSAICEMAAVTAFAVNLLVPF